MKGTRGSTARTALTVLMFTVVGICAIDLFLRQVVRLSLAELAGWADFGAERSVVVAASVVLIWGATVCRRALKRNGREDLAPSRWREADTMVCAVLAFGLVAGLYAQQRLGARLQSDGFYYYAYLRSIVVDGDVDFTNDYRLLGLSDKPHLFVPTPTGYAQSAWTIGPAILWAPFYGVGHIAAESLQARGRDVETNGTSFPYRQAICAAGLVYGLFGLGFAYRLTRVWFGAPISAAATFGVALGSFMIWYLVKEPTMTHAPAMAGVAAFALAWARTRDRRSVLQWALLGVLAGFITNVRWQNAIFVLLPAVEWLYGATRWRWERSTVGRDVLAGFLFVAGAVVGFLPQMIAWKAIYGAYFAISPVGPQIRWWDSHAVDILWSSRNGLFATSPVAYVAALGLFLMLKRDWRFGLPAIISVAAMVYFNGAIQDWWGSAAFGMRRFDGVVPLLVVGLAAAISTGEAWILRHPRAVVTGALVVLILWNLSFMAVAVRGAFGIGDLVSFGVIGSEQAQTIHRWIGHPFSWPVNLVWALRNGVSPGRYDLLGAGRFLADPLRPYGRVNIGDKDDEVYLGEGWHAAERSGETTYRWARQEAEVLVPLDHAAPLKVQLQVMPFQVPGRAPIELRVAINGRTFGPYVLRTGWQMVEFSSPDRVWSSGVNRVTLRPSGETRPRDVGAGGDDRLLSVAVDFVRVQVQ